MKKNTLLSWTERLKSYAKEQNLPTRILDSIENCQRHIRLDNRQWPETRQSIENILESIRLKISDSQSVPTTEVETQIKTIAEQCHKKNLSSLTNIEQRKILSIKECLRKMDEIAFTKAHLDTISNEGMYLSFFQQIQQSYEEDMLQTSRQLVKDVGENCSHMMDHMHSMFHHIGAYSEGIGHEKFYKEYETQRDTLENKIMGEVMTADFGSSAVMSFAHKTKNGVRHIAKKYQRKKRVFLWMPVLLLFIMFITIAGATSLQYSSQKTAAKTQTVSANESANENSGHDENKEYSLIDPIKNQVAGKLITPGIFASSAYFFGGLSAGLGILLAFLLLLFVVAYTYYIHRLQTWCRHQICEKCELYLKSELEQFKQNDEMNQIADNTVQDIVIEYERQYLTILNRILKGTRYDQEKQENNATFQSLWEEWMNLK